MPVQNRWNCVQDALWGAAQFILRAKQHVMDNYTPGVCNIGMIKAKPGAFNIVPAEVYCALEFRHGNRGPRWIQMQADLLRILRECAAEFNLSVDCQATPPVIPAKMSESVMGAIERAADALGLSRERMLSFAGHDTQNVAAIAPAAMYFVPSVDGISHNPKEHTSDADCVNGANLMLHTLLGVDAGLCLSASGNPRYSLPRWTHGETRRPRLDPGHANRARRHS